METSPSLSSAPPAFFLKGPLVFTPLAQQRVWGGRNLESVLGRSLPDDGAPYGESWELCDRPEAQTSVADGPLAGRTLHELWTDPDLGPAIFGSDKGTRPERFPLLIKILDAQDTLSLQVHPPASEAEALGGEPKTEMWYVAAAEPGAALYVGFRKPVTPASFEQALRDGTAADLVARREVQAGDFLFIPSGRIHAIGAGLIIFEIQQNSDTTYRVFDWNRVGLDGQPRQLHVEQALRSIDFTDVDPPVELAEGTLLVDCPYFRVERHTVEPAETLLAGQGRGAGAVLVTVVEGTVTCGNPGRDFGKGDFFLIPACWTEATRGFTAGAAGATVLLTTW